MGDTLKKAEELEYNGMSENQDKQNSFKLLETEEVVDTPFIVMKGEDEDWFVAMANYKLSEGHKTKEEAITDATTLTWNRMIQVMEVVCKFTLELKEKE